MNLSDDEMARLKELLRLDAVRRKNAATKQFHRETLQRLRVDASRGDAVVAKYEAKIARIKGKRSGGIRVGWCSCGCGKTVYWIPGKPPVKTMKSERNFIYSTPECLQKLLRVNGIREPLRKVA